MGSSRAEERRLDSHHVTILYQSYASLNMLMADSENLPKARVASDSNFWFSVCVQQIELESIPMV